ncbi:hypothetical protein DMA11_13750 [Marinilabiliaceae bacterium JC017]|nr:hypothetical protein DMA11_13750 [Marinilabiliaceae bacterium JC017]
MNNEIYIKRKDKTAGRTSYASLQREALEAVQQMSGNIWTDYNEHDPGVTILDILNYALTELDYKNSFPLEDYLCSSEKNFVPEDYGFYNPLQVFPSGPVTRDDYRKLIFDHIPELLDLWIVELKEPFYGLYDILLELQPGKNNREVERVKDEVYELFHANRNLGEDLRSVDVIERQELELHGEIELQEGADASEVLGKIYMECLSYFTPGIRYRQLQELLSEGVGWDDLLNGPLITRGIINNHSLKPLNDRYYVSALHHRIRKVNGVKLVRNIFLKDENGILPDEIDLGQFFTVKVPLRSDEVKLKLVKGSNVSSVDIRKVLKSFKEQRAHLYGTQNLFAGIDDQFGYPQGSYRKLKEYYSIQNDFPEFYGINEMGIPSYFSEERKAEARQLKAYLLLYDLLLAGSMNELENAHQLLKLSPDIPENRLPQLDEPVYLWDKIVDEDLFHEVKDYQAGFLMEEKEKVYDVLDALYGENSQLEFLSEFDVHSQKPADNLQRRAHFLELLPQLGLEKSRGINLLNVNAENVPGPKKWISSLLGFGVENEIPVTNVFARYALKLVSDDEFYEDMRGLLNIDFILDNPFDEFKQEVIFDIPVQEVDSPWDDYLSFKNKIYLLDHNIVFESLLRNGCDIERYKIISLTAEDEFLLIYNSAERKEWINLGRFGSKQEVVRTANQFRQFLVMLNQQSETFYLVEHLLLRSVDNADGYSLLIRDAMGHYAFRLLNPVGYDNIQRLKEEVQEVFRQVTSFLVEKTENGRYVILYHMSDGSVLYCLQEFPDKEIANAFLTSFADTYLTNPGEYMETNYQRDLELLLPADFMDLKVSVVFPSWSARFNNKKFRSWCEEILAERMPAHLKVDTYWLDVSLIREFEKLYFQWREAFVNGNREGKEESAIALSRWLGERSQMNESHIEE